jgi:hypothetical protein
MRVEVAYFVGQHERSEEDLERSSLERSRLSILSSFGGRGRDDVGRSDLRNVVQGEDEIFGSDESRVEDLLDELTERDRRFDGEDGRREGRDRRLARRDEGHEVGESEVGETLTACFLLLSRDDTRSTGERTRGARTIARESISRRAAKSSVSDRTERVATRSTPRSRRVERGGVRSGDLVIASEKETLTTSFPDHFDGEVGEGDSREFDGRRRRNTRSVGDQVVDDGLVVVLLSLNLSIVVV